MKKICVFIFSILVIITSINLDNNEIVLAATNARTLKELRNELEGLKRQQIENKNKQTATENAIKNAKYSVSSKQTEISTNQKKVEDAMNESAKLTTEIEEGKDKIKNIMQSYQVANADNIYLEYLFNSKSYEDLLYRYAVMEQVMGYQNDLIGEWNDKIDQNTQLKIDLEKREVQLNKQIDSLANQIDDLGDELEGYLDESMDIKDEISSTQELISYYEKLGCGENEDLDECVKVRGDTGFRKPLNRGTITSYFGYRTHPVTGVTNKFHTGTDIGGNKEGTSVYSAANGMVGKIIYRASCGGNQVYIYHTINGKKYTTAYLHLLTINVKLGDSVNSNTVIGTVGGGAGTRSYDSCSTGAHLHLSVGTGWYGSSYTSYSKWVANLLDAKDVFKLPQKGSYWNAR